jgi:periplasmic divalent cation tolerance protein
MNKAVLLQSTTDSEQEAKNCAKLLIEKNYAACVTIIPHTKSFYKWENKLVEDEEFELQIKTFSKYLEKIKKVINKEISYEIPQIIVTEIIEMSAEYYQWFLKQFKE